MVFQNGDPVVTALDIASIWKTQETLALLTILALGNQEVAIGKVKPAAEVFAQLGTRRAVA